MRKFNRKAIAVTVGTVVLLSGAGAAFAYWTTTGSGNGAATNAASGGTVTLHANFAAGLAPGGSKAVSYTADNLGSSNLFVTSLINPVVTTSDVGCLPADFTITAVVTSSGVMVPAGVSGVSVGNGTLAFANTGVSQDLCKSATVTVSLSSN